MVENFWNNDGNGWALLSDRWNYGTERSKSFLKELTEDYTKTDEETLYYRLCRCNSYSIWFFNTWYNIVNRE